MLNDSETERQLFLPVLKNWITFEFQNVSDCETVALGAQKQKDWDCIYLLLLSSLFLQLKLTTEVRMYIYAAI
jgi:hypothetical protein